jgi:prepilin-type N-terminal cleavage/methylation domain-containing protein
MMTMRRGLSMIELMFVVVILGTLIALTLPRMAGTGDRAALSTAGRDIARMAAMARQNAISMNAETRLIFSMGGNTWRMILPETEEPVSGRYGRERLSTWEQPQILHSRVRFSEFLTDGTTVREDELVVKFLPNGSSTGGTIILTNKRDRKMTISIERATGMASADMGEPMSFADRVVMAGGDPSKFAGAEPSTMAATLPDEEGEPRFYAVERTADERVSAYEDAAARIMGRVVRENERKQVESGGPEREITPAGGKKE